MMDAVEYLKIKSRLCKGNCENCPLSSYNNEFSFSCDDYEQAYPEKAIATAEKWAREHPIKTYKDALLELLPNAMLCAEGIPKTCRQYAFGGECLVGDGYRGEGCVTCWNEEYNEVDNG